MNVLEHFSVPYLGLNPGKHEFFFEADDLFFKQFENSLIASGDFEVRLELDKRPDMGEALIFIDGKVEVDCDRCLQPVTVYVESDVKLLIKYSEDQLDNDEVMFINPDTSAINFAHVIYEYICLALPLTNMHEDEEDCDPAVIEKLRINKTDDLNDDTPNIWGNLKDLDLS